MPTPLSKNAWNTRLSLAIEPDLDMVVSPVSASRSDKGRKVLLEKRKTSICQTVKSSKMGSHKWPPLWPSSNSWEHKSEDYGQEGAGRECSTLFRYALSKSWWWLTAKGYFLVHEENVSPHWWSCYSTLIALGLAFKDEKLLSVKQWMGFVLDRVMVDAHDGSFKSPVVLCPLSIRWKQCYQHWLGWHARQDPMTGELIKDESDVTFFRFVLQKVKRFLIVTLKYSKHQLLKWTRSTSCLQ